MRPKELAFFRKLIYLKVILLNLHGTGCVMLEKKTPVCSDVKHKMLDQHDANVNTWSY